MVPAIKELSLGCKQYIFIYRTDIGVFIPVIRVLVEFKNREQNKDRRIALELVKAVYSIIAEESLE